MIAIATAILFYALGINELSDALTLGVIVGVGYSAAISLNNAITPNMPKQLLFGTVTGGYHIVGAVLVSAILFSLR